MPENKKHTTSSNQEDHLPKIVNAIEKLEAELRRSRQGFNRDLAKLEAENEGLKQTVKNLASEIDRQSSESISNIDLVTIIRNLVEPLPKMGDVAIPHFEPSNNTAKSPPQQVSDITEVDAEVLVVCRAGDELINKGRARSIWAANVASSLSHIGFNTSLTGRATTPPLKLEHPEGLNAVLRKISTTYGVEENFKVDVTNPPRKSNCVDGTWEIKNSIPEKISKYKYVYCRDPRVAQICVSNGIPFIYEDHNEDFHENAHQSLPNELNSTCCCLIVAITKQVKARLVQSGVKEEKISVFDSGVCMDAYRTASNKPSRWKNFLLKNIFDHLLVYTGGLQAERGIQQIFEAAALLPNCLFVLAGGRKNSQLELQSLAKMKGLQNLRLVGYLNKIQANELQQAADVLLLTREDSNRKLITSPFKLFEYLAAQRPIISYTLPDIDTARVNLPIQEYSPMTGEGLVEAIQETLKVHKFGAEHYKNGWAYASQREWTRRQEQIVTKAGWL